MLTCFFRLGSEGSRGGEGSVTEDRSRRSNANDPSLLSSGPAVVRI